MLLAAPQGFTSIENKENMHVFHSRTRIDTHKRIPKQENLQMPYSAGEVLF
jgi:hypothetical protein